MSATAHDWKVVAPWYRWARVDGAEPWRVDEAPRPALHKFVSTSFAHDFLADPQRSVVFDAGLDVLQRVEPIPTAELVVNGRLRSLARNRLVQTSTRKLFLPAHQRFYILAVGLHCDRAGFPKVDPERVDEVGFVVRRVRMIVPVALRPDAAKLLHEIAQARVTAQVKAQFDAARESSRLLHPFRARATGRVLAPAATAQAAARDVELARRRLRTWAAANAVEQRTEAWVATGDGSFGSWVAVPDEPEELVERTYPMRLLAAPPTDPEHAAHEGTIYFAAVPTSSDEITPEGTSRFNAIDTYEVRAYARAGNGPCPGPLVWSQPTHAFRLASFYDPTGSAQRPIEIHLPDFAQLEATTAPPSVRMTSPPSSSLEFSKFGEIPTKGRLGAGQEVCFFSIPLITIIAMFVLNLFLPIVMFVFQLWWMLKLKFCIPPSVEFEADLAAELDVKPPELQLLAEVDVDVKVGVVQADLANVLASVFNPPADPVFDPADPDHTRPLDPVPADWQLGDRLVDPATGLFTNNPLFHLTLDRGFGTANDGSPTFAAPVVYTSRVRRDEVVHP